MELLKKISKQTCWQIVGKIVTSISTLIILGMVTRNYQKEGVGIFTLALTYLAMFNLLSDFGFNVHVLKKHRFEWQKLLGTRIIWSAVLMILASFLFPFLPFSSKSLNQAVFFGSIGVLASAVFITCNLVFQSKLRYDLSVLASSLGTLTGLVIIWFLISRQFPVPYLLIGNSVSWIIIAVISILILKKFYQNLIPIFDYQYTLNLIKQTWPIAATLALNVVYFRVDSFLITFYKGLSDTGVYNVAYSIFQSALVLPTFIMNAYYPLMLKSRKDYRDVLFALFGLALLGTIVVSIFSPILINLIAGSRFNSSSESLKILSFSFPAFFLSNFFLCFLIANNKYKRMFMIYFFGLIINLILNFIFIPKFSYVGASWITVISEYLILGLQLASLIW